MKAAFLTGLRQVEVREAPEPKVEREDDVLLRIEVVGVCGSDMHYYRTGRIGTQVVEFPWIVGHECSGEVLAVGEAVTNVRVGERVAVDPLLVCGECDQCRTGRAHTCRNQAFLGCPGQRPGALAERLVMPASCCYPVPAGLDAIRTTLLEPFAIGYYARTLAGDPAGRAFGVFGSGPIGLCVLQALRAGGAKTVHVTDIRDNRAELASRMGADWTGNPRKRDVVTEIAAREPLGLDAAFECAGEQETMDQAVELLKPGGTLLLVGIPEFDRASFAMDLLRRKELTITNVRRQNECVQAAMDLVATGKVDLDPMVTHEFDLADTQAAFDTVADYRDGVVKAIIHVP